MVGQQVEGLMEETNTKKLVTYTQGNLYKLKWVGGGELPAALSGGYTTPAQALKAAEDYLNTRQVKAPHGKVNNSRAK